MAKRNVLGSVLLIVNFLMLLVTGATIAGLASLKGLMLSQGLSRSDIAFLDFKTALLFVSLAVFLSFLAFGLTRFVNYPGAIAPRHAMCLVD